MADDSLKVPKRVISYVLSDFVQPKNSVHPVVRVTSTSSVSDRIPRKLSGLNEFVIDVLEIGTSSIFFTSATSLREAKAATRFELSRLGYTVYVGSPARRVYVIEYSPSFRADSSDVWLYVGETGKPVEDRVEQHLSGDKKASRGWQHLSHRRADLEPPAEYWSVEDSRQAEREWGLRLSAAQYRVRGPQGFNSKTGLPVDQP